MREDKIEELFNEASVLPEVIKEAIASLVEAIKETEDLKDSLPTKESLGEAGDKINQSLNALKGFYEKIKKESTEEKKEVVGLHKNYVSIMSSTKGDFENMVKQFLSNKLSDFHLNAEGIQAIVDKEFKEITDSIDYHTIRETKEKMQHELKEMKRETKENLNALVKIKTESEELALARANNIYRITETKTSLMKDMTTKFRSVIDGAVSTLESEKSSLESATEAVKGSNDLVEKLIKENEARDEALDERLKKMESVTTRKLGFFKALAIGSICFSLGVAAIIVGMDHIAEEILFKIIDTQQIMSAE